MLRFIIAVSSARVPAWQRWCIDALRALDGDDIEVRVAHAGVDRSPPSPLNFVTGPALALAPIVLDEIDTSSADVVLDLTGESAVAPNAAHGVWSFWLAGSDDPSLPFAREIAAGARRFDIRLLRRTALGATTLRRGRFPVTESYASTLRLALSQAATWPASIAVLLGAGSSPVVEAAPPAERRIPLAPFEWLRFALALGRGVGRAVASELLEVTEWNVGFAPGDPRRLLSGEPLDVRWLPRPARGTFIADPFVVERDGVRALFVEAFDIRMQRGVVDAMVLGDDERVGARRRVLELPTHLSFPYPIEIDGELYLVPENCAGNEVALYRCTGFPDRWKREAALFPNYDGVDTTLFAFEGRWWAFGTRYLYGPNVALYAHHAASPRGPWTAHLLNPIVCDVSSARPAGRPFVVDGVLYRVGQDSTRSYGDGIAIARVDALSATSYRETIVRRFDGHACGRWKDGFHTLDFTRGEIVVDGKYTYLSLRKLPHSLPAFAQRVASLLGARSEPG